MSRRRKKTTEETEPEIRFGPTDRHVHTGTYLDPRLPLPGPVRQVRDQRPSRAERRTKREQYEAYLQLLIKHNGNYLGAIADLYGLGPEEAEENGPRLHQELVKSGMTERTLEEMLKHYDLTQPALLSVLRLHLFSDSPAASLKAAEKVQELWGTQQVGESVEDLVRLALAEE